MLGHEWFGDITASRTRKARVEKGLTIRDPAAAIGMTEVIIIRIENSNSTPAITTLKLISEALGVSVSHLGCFKNLMERTFGERFTKARMCHGLTKLEMARNIGVGAKKISGWGTDKHEPLLKYMSFIEMYFAILDK